MQTLKITSDPDIDQKQESPDRPYWNVGYSQSVRVNIGADYSYGCIETASKMEEKFHKKSVFNRRHVLEKTFLDNYCIISKQ